MTQVMYSDISGESPILIIGLAGLVIWGSIGAYVSYKDTGNVELSTVLLYSAAGLATGMTAGVAIEILTALKAASYMVGIGSLLMADGDPTNEAIYCIDTYKTIEANMKTVGQFRKFGQHLHHIIP